MNILVCTPGRILQHMSETSYFFCDNLQVLVLDEADRCLDQGFARALNAIVENLPKKRQTLLFSATQTKKVKDLARLSLKVMSLVLGKVAHLLGNGASVVHPDSCEITASLPLWTHRTQSMSAWMKKAHTSPLIS